MGMTNNTPDTINNPIEPNSDNWIKTIIINNENINSNSLDEFLTILNNISTPTYIESTQEHTTSSNTFVSINSMTVTPEQGRYLVYFSCSLETAGINVEGEVSLFKNDTVIGSTIREIRNSVELLGLITISTNDIATPSSTLTIVECDGTESISAKFRVVSGGSLKAGERSLTLIKLKDA